MLKWQDDTCLSELQLYGDLIKRLYPVYNNRIKEDMTDNELNDIIKTLKAIPDSNDDLARAVLKAAADSITLDKIKALTNVHAEAECQKNIKINSGSETLCFSKKEIDRMPRTFRKQFRCKGLTAHVHRRRSGKHNWNYEIRCQINYQKINVSSNNLEEAKIKFIKRLEEIESGKTAEAANSIPVTMDKFSMYYFENFRKRKVSPNTYRITLNQYKNHIFPHFKDMPLKKITPKMCQELLDKIHHKIGIERTAEDIFTLLNLTFKAAIKHGILQNNPMDMVFREKHEREHGTALSKAEEKILLDAVKDTPLEIMFAVALYTGLRPNEYETAVIEGNFIRARNSKRKNGKTEYKKIPITPMLMPYLKGKTELNFLSEKTIRNGFNQILPSHKLYDLRTTFYTRCTECGIAEVAIKKFVGHALGGLADTYTDLSDEFLLAEGSKLNY